MNEKLQKMLEYNKIFVEHQMYSKYETTKYPNKKIAILTCMDTRLTELLPAALGLSNGDVKVIKNAGGRITHPYGSAIFSLIVAVYELGVNTIMVIGHDDCGGQALDGKKLIQRMLEAGISEEDIHHVNTKYKNLEEWLTGFGDVDATVQETVNAIKSHPLIHKNVEVVGFIMNPHTGELRQAGEKEGCCRESI
jgi:carbonic anhydrase